MSTNTPRERGRLVLEYRKTLCPYCGVRLRRARICRSCGILGRSELQAQTPVAAMKTLDALDVHGRYSFGVISGLEK